MSEKEANKGGLDDVTKTLASQNNVLCMFLTMNKSFDFRQMREEICVATIYYIFIKIISDKVLSTNWCGDFNSLG